MKTKEQIEETIQNLETTFKKMDAKVPKEWQQKISILNWVLED